MNAVDEGTAMLSVLEEENSYLIASCGAEAVLWQVLPFHDLSLGGPKLHLAGRTSIEEQRQLKPGRAKQREESEKTSDEQRRSCQPTAQEENCSTAGSHKSETRAVPPRFDRTPQAVP